MLNKEYVSWREEATTRGKTYKSNILHMLQDITKIIEKLDDTDVGDLAHIECELENLTGGYENFLPTS